MGSRKGPERLSTTLSELIGRLGLAQSQGNAELADAWRRSAGNDIANNTRLLSVRNGVVHIEVRHAALLSRLASFEQPRLLEALKNEMPDVRVHDLKFKLNGDLPRKTA